MPTTFLPDRQEQKLQSKLKIDIFPQTDFCLGDRFQDFFQILIRTLAGLFLDKINFLLKYQIVNLSGCLKHQYIPEPELENIQIVIDVMFFFRKLLNFVC